MIVRTSHETETRQRSGPNGRRPDRGLSHSTRSERVEDKTALWKRCEAALSRGLGRAPTRLLERISLEGNRVLEGGQIAWCGFDAFAKVRWRSPPPRGQALPTRQAHESAPLPTLHVQT